MMFARYETWRRAKTEDLVAHNPRLKCPTCSGEGVVYDECRSCSHETEEDCTTCDTQGEVYFNDLFLTQWQGIFTHQAYFKELVEVAHDLSAHCGSDFFELMCDAVKVSTQKYTGFCA
ncbi:hypothetical protein HCU74_08235 [Spongiibacter sp. KMU-166]|uniref:Uncharacterized protein n=1 Tax=Spongiibacter thalassae TaxID=2721624 RepID=A0ABX1GG39_9GAMM|nr:hypothetical protein [Spongiibacter thalassae]NKI17403.1 hypothetical protein [Spongiibacter thalassae]